MTVAMDSWFSRTGVFTDVVFVGDAVRDTFPSFDRVKARRCVIRNGTDPVPEELTRASSSSRSSTVSVVSVGALIPRKNLDLLVRACARAKAVTRLVIVGDGPERRAIADLAGALGVNLVLVGQIPAREVLPETRRHTVFAFPSRAEALPLALIEAAKAGMPILASDIEPNQEVVGSAALFRGVDDVEGWAEALDELVGDVNLRERLGKAAVLRTQGFGASQMLAAYEQVLRAR